jgi:3-hydroxyacyl-[acyl-carrier-protein] dehydratase
LIKQWPDRLYKLTHTNYFIFMERNIEDFIHHRKPYLMVDAVLESNPERIICQKLTDNQDYYAGGHFPGASIVPGAVLNEMTTQSAGILIAKYYNPMQDYNTHDPFHNEMALGVLKRIKDARFKGLVKTGELLTIQVELLNKVDELFEFKGEVFLDGKRIMVNTFQLVNIPSKLLYS